MVPTPLEPISPHSYSRPESHTLLLTSVEPSRAGSSGESVGDGRSVGDATGLAGASVGAGLGMIGSGEEVGPADDDDDVGAGEVTSSCIAPADPLS